MRLLLIISAFVVACLGSYAIYGSLGRNIMEAISFEGNITSQMLLEVFYLGIGLLLLCFAISWLSLAYIIMTMKKSKA